MNLLTSIHISSSGLKAERTRLNVASMNLANVHVTRTIDGGPYRARSVVFESTPLEDDFGAHLSEAMKNDLQVVKVVDIVEDPGPFKEVFDPSHPDADERGIVKLPNVNVMEQMMDLMTAARAYEAGVTAMDTAKDMVLKALEIAR